MDRTRRGFWRWTGLFACLWLAAAGGCAGPLFTAMYLLKGNNTPAEFDELKDKRVLVVCRPLVQLEYSAGFAPDQIAEQIGNQLKLNYRKIEVIDQQEVAEWTDEHRWNEYTEIGRGLEAEMVVAVDLEDFRLYQGQTLYQGQATIHVRVFDMTQNGAVVYEKELPRLVYPPNTGIDTSSRTEDEFRRQFILVVADEVGRYFYPHDPHRSIAVDSRAVLQ